MRAEVSRPFLMINTKSYKYSYGKKLNELATRADELATTYNITILLTCQYTSIREVSEKTQNLIVTAQHMDSLEEGLGMGHVLPNAIYEAGARAVVLNHAEKPLISSDLSKSINKAKKLGMKSIICADSVTDAKAFAMMNPDILLMEPTNLIGTGQTSSDNYIIETNRAIREINNDVFIMQGAGISTADDITRSLELGADGNGVTSGIVANENPLKILNDMILATAKFN